MRHPALEYLSRRSRAHNSTPSTSLIAALIVATTVACAKHDAATADSSGGASSASATSTTTSSATSSSQPGSGAADDQALNDFQLTSDNVAKATVAAKNVADLLKSRPDLQKRTEDSTMSNAKSIQDMANRINSIPELRHAIESAGISSRDYALLTISAAGARVANAYAKETRGKPLPPGATPANIAFVAAHPAEIARMDSAMMGESRPNGKDQQKN